MTEILERKAEAREGELISLKEKLAEKEKEAARSNKKKEDVEKEKQKKIEEMTEKCEKIEQEKEEWVRRYKESKQNYDTLKEITISGGDEEEVAKMAEENIAKEGIIGDLAAKLSLGDEIMQESLEEEMEDGGHSDADEYIDDDDLSDKVFEDNGAKRKITEREGEEAKVSPENKKVKEYTTEKKIGAQGDMTGYEEGLEISNESIDLTENLEKENSFLPGNLTKDQHNEEGSSQSFKLVLSQSQTQTDLEWPDAQRVQEEDYVNDQVLGGGTIPPDRGLLHMAPLSSRWPPKPQRQRSRTSSNSSISQSVLAETFDQNMEEVARNPMDGLVLHIPIQGGSPGRTTENLDQLRDKYATMKD